MQNAVRVVLKENLERGVDNFFAEELRRQELYDNERCLEQWREAIQHVKQNGFDKKELLRLYGEKVLDIPEKALSLIVQAYNITEEDNPFAEGTALDKLPFNFESQLFDSDLIRKIAESKKAGVVSSEDTFLRVADSLPGFSLLFAQDQYSRTEKESIGFPSLKLYGVPEAAIEGVKGRKNKTLALELGTLSLEGLGETAERRFSFIFGTSPVNDSKIIDALIKLNNFPRFTGQRPSQYEVVYTLVPEKLETLNPPRAVTLLNEEAQTAVEEGLFSRVQPFGLQAKELAYRDPVLVCYDHFEQKLPLIYWAGDKSDLKKLSR